MQTHETVSSRDAVGCKIGWVGLAGNLFLVFIKMSVGYFSNSIAIIADALNNLMDCASSVVTILGFFLASKGKDSIVRLTRPQQVHVSKIVTVTLLVGIAVKLLMAVYMTRLNKTMSSPAVTAVRNDNLSDSLVTLVTLIGILLIPFTMLPIDGFLGILVALFILGSGIISFRENLILLLGEGVNKETEENIRNIISEYSLFKNVEMITLHDYGPGEKLAFIKVAFQKSPHSPEAAEILEHVKRRLQEELELNATLYWDTIDKSMLKEGYARDQQNHFR